MSGHELGVGVVGVGWAGTQHVGCFVKNPHCRIVGLCGQSPDRVRANLAGAGLSLPDAYVTDDFGRLVDDPDIQLIAIATPNDKHAAEAVAAARAGKHLLIEKPVGMNEGELTRILDAVEASGVRTIVSFELRFNPYLRYLRWLRESGRLGDLRFARLQYLSHVTDWYAGWEWLRTRERGGSHLVAAGCHAADALRWLTGWEPEQVSAFNTRFTHGYEWPTTIEANLLCPGGALAHVTSSTDFMMPYTFGIELMGDRMTVRDGLLLWSGDAPDREELLDGFEGPVTLEPDRYGENPALRIVADMPDSVDVSHHPFQDEADELVAAILEGRESAIDVRDAARTMRLCFAADASAEAGGRPITLGS